MMHHEELMDAILHAQQAKREALRKYSQAGMQYAAAKAQKSPAIDLAWLGLQEAKATLEAVDKALGDLQAQYREYYAPCKEAAR